MVGSCGRSAGVLLLVGYRSSSGSIAGLALTYQSPDLCRDKTAVVKQAELTMRLLRTAAPACNVQCDEVDGVRYLLPPDLPSPVNRHRVEGSPRLSLKAFPYGNSR